MTILKKNKFRFPGGLILLALSILLIFYQFNQIPKNISYDEIEFVQLALSLDNKPYTPFSPIAFGHSTLYFYILLLSFKIFGINNFALRLPAAVFGVLGVFLFYLIMKIIFKKSIIYYLSAIIFLTMRWYLNFSRFSFEATFLIFLELSSIYFLLLSFDNDVSRFTFHVSIIFSGLFAGLAFNSYTPGRIFFLLLLVLLIIKLINIRQITINYLTIKPLIFFLVPFLIIIAPLTIYLIKNKDPRFQSQYFLSKKNLSISKKISYLWSNIKSTALMFHFYGDMNGRHNFPGKPALNPILGILFVIGFIIAIKNYKNIYYLLFIIYYFLSILPSIFTNPLENPNMLRIFTVIPSIVFFIGLTLQHFITIVTKYVNFRFSFFLIFLTVIISSAYELYTYFYYQKRVFRNSFEVKCPIEKIINGTGLIPKSCLVSKNEF